MSFLLLLPPLLFPSLRVPAVEEVVVLFTNRNVPGSLGFL